MGKLAERVGALLFLRLDQALTLEKAAKNLRDRLVIRYMVYNGLSPMEVSEARIENLDPVECTLFLPRRHWKRNCVADVDPETVRLQVVYSGARKKGPLIRNKWNAHFSTNGLWKLVKVAAARTAMPGAERISPLVLKRTFAREWLLSGGTIGSLQKQLSHKHLWSTAHYLRFVLEDVRRNHARLMERVAHEERDERPRLVS